MDIAQSWLDLQCRTVSGIDRAVLLTGEALEGLELAATWPPDSPTASAPAADMRTCPLVAAARKAAESRAGVVQQLEADETSQARSIIAAPLQAGSIELGAAAVELHPNSTIDHQGVLQVLQWGGQWLGLLRRQGTTASEPPLSGILDLLIATLDHAELSPAALTLVTELAGKSGCDRVSLGLLHGRKMRIRAMSHTATVDRRTNLIRDIEGAMHEAVDQDASVPYPPPKDASPLIAFAQEVLSERAERVAVCSVPLFSSGRAIGALTFERSASQAAFTQTQVDELNAIGALLGPILELKHERERPLLWKLKTGLSRAAAGALGRHHWKLKLVVLTGIAFLAGTFIVERDYRITAPATVEGHMQRVVTAPHDGFIGTSSARAGDPVKEGDVLTTLDGRELRLEALTLNAEREQLIKEKRAALTGHDRSALALVQARIRQADAHLALVRSRIERNEIRAPFDGMVVAGDLSQALGAPVEHGQTLFEIAPLDAYRVMLQVDERDIENIAKGRSGTLILTGLPGRKFTFDVTRVQPLTRPVDGKNVFLAEAALRGDETALRPGMAGIGKVDVERRRLIWIWTHSLVDWLHLTWWRWGG